MTEYKEENDMSKAAVQAKLQSPIDKGATDLSNAINDLESSVHELLHRIRSVVVEEREEAAQPEVDEDDVPKSTLTSYLKDEIKHVNRLEKAVRNTTWRIEL